MRYIKYFKSYVLLMVLCILPESALALIIEKECGKYTFQVEVLSDKKLNESQYILYYKEGKKRILFYKVELGLGIEAACIQNMKKRYLMLFQEFCGGNGCPEGVYGIFDPKLNKMLIKPSDWPKGNTKEVANLIGYPAPFYSDESGLFFCCSN